jgi:tetraacyldisaccharide 4'-kinase
MRGLESRLNAIWYAGAPAPWVLSVLARIYAAGMAWRSPITAQRLPVPIIVVGNFTVGGTGKTPVIIALVDYLKTAGHTPGVVSRGYGRSGSGPVSVVKDSQVSVTGDEPLLIARRCGVPVRVDADRRRAAEFLIRSGCSVIVSDDGLQHQRLPRSLEIEIIDDARGYGNGLLLPAGPLREWPRKVDFRIRNGQGTDDAHAYGMQLNSGFCRNLVSDEVRALSDFSGSRVHALAGIGNPDRFFGMLRHSGIQVIQHAFPDHHRFVAADVPEGPVLMTEKDAVKVPTAGRQDLWSVAVDAVLSTAFYAQFNRRLSADGDHHA